MTTICGFSGTGPQLLTFRCQSGGSGSITIASLATGSTRNKRHLNTPTKCWRKWNQRNSRAWLFGVGPSGSGRGRGRGIIYLGPLSYPHHTTHTCTHQKNRKRTERKENRTEVEQNRKRTAFFYQTVKIKPEQLLGFPTVWKLTECFENWLIVCRLTNVKKIDA